ncbi:MAG: AarF/UbiB family protein [Natrialbaceae archaeon]|nr:AarF/UbiB family protein [Natrialbaceae archaeon]
MLSTRPDVLPSEFVRELESLQDDVPPAPWEEARTVIEAELGPIEKRFDDFDRQAISGASLGQVYRATVDGEPVAVKVRRPGLERQVETDLAALEKLLRLLTVFLDEGRAYSVENLAAHFRETIRDEMDYRREARMLETISENFPDDNRLRIPTVIETHSTERVLTMEYLEGVKVTDVEAIDELDIDRAQLSKNLHKIYLQMVLVDGVFHGDPHPGNLAVQEDGTAVFYDFGMSDHIDDELRRKFIDFYLSVGSEDPERIMEALVDIGTVHPKVLDEGREKMTELIALEVDRAQGGELNFGEFQEIASDLEDVMYEVPFRLPQDMAMVMRVMAIGKGVFETLNPDHDMVEVTAEFMAEQDYAESDTVQDIMNQGLQIGT